MSNIFPQTHYATIRSIQSLSTKNWKHESGCDLLNNFTITLSRKSLNNQSIFSNTGCPRITSWSISHTISSFSRIWLLATPMFEARCCLIRPRIKNVWKSSIAISRGANPHQALYCLIEVPNSKYQSYVKQKVPRS